MNAPLLSHLRLMLPTACGEVRGFVLSEPRHYPRASAGAFNRIAFSAADVVADARADNDPWTPVISTGTRRSLSGSTSGRSASESPRRWIRRRAWDSIGRAPAPGRTTALPRHWIMREGTPCRLPSPPHPIERAERSCINTLSHALDICDALDPGRTGALGVARDVYHTWWDPQLETQIKRTGRERLLAYHVCDWLVPTLIY